jgi:hypothetical protein
MTDSRLESLIASEVHARIVGEDGQQLLDSLAKEKGSKGIIDKLKQWILDFWKDLKATFSNWSQEDLDKLTLKDFTVMTVRDFADAVDFADVYDKNGEPSTDSLIAFYINPNDRNSLS